MPQNTVAPQSIQADFSVTPGQLKQLLLELMPTGNPIMIWGPPGVGKSTICRSVALELGRRYYDFRANLIESFEIKGLPWHDATTNTTRYAPPEMLPPMGCKNSYTINYDELPAALPSVQTALYQILTDNAVGTYVLPQDTYQLACGNKLSHRSVSYEMPAALVRRFMHIDLKSSLTDWCDWASRNDISPDIIFYLYREEKMLNNFDQVQDENEPFACEATWEMASNIRKAQCDFSPYLERAAYAGTVGKAAAIGYTSFLRMMDNLPHPRVIVLDPHNAAIPPNASEVIATCGALCNIATAANLDAIYIYLKRLGRELTEFTMGTIIKRQPDLKREPTFMHWTCEKTQPAVPPRIAQALP